MMDWKAMKRAPVFSACVGSAFVVLLVSLSAASATYALERNAGLNSLSVRSTSPTFDSWFAGAGLDRPLGRTARLSIGYTAYVPGSNAAGRSIGTCGSYVQHQGFGQFSMAYATPGIALNYKEQERA